MCVGPATHHVKKENATETPTKENPANQVLGGAQMAQASVAGMPSMKRNGQIRKEAFDPTRSLTSPRRQLRVGLWNTRTMYETGKTAQVIGEMQRYRLNILGVSEVRWTGSGRYVAPTGEIMYYSGREDGQHRQGVGIILDKEANKSLMEWEPVNNRIIRARLYSKFTKMTIVQCYAPTEEADDAEKDEFYAQLQGVLESVPKHDILLVMGDLNAKVGADNLGFEQCIGGHGLGTRNDNGERFLEFCVENEMTIGGTIFKHKDIHKHTWNSPDGVTFNQIDHVAINQRWRSTMFDVRAIRGGDIGSDHNLVLCKLRLKLKRTKKEPTQRLFNSLKLRDPETRKAFSIELSNRYHLLDELPIDDLNDYCNKVRDTFTGTSQLTLGFKDVSRKPWISDETWQLIDERKALKQRILSSNEEDRRTISDMYRQKNRSVKRSAKKDKRNYLKDKATEAQEAATVGDSRTLYKITRELTGTWKTQNTVVRDKEGKVVSKEEDQLARWAEHFQGVLNRPDPVMPAEIQGSTREFEMKRGPILCHEIQTAIRETKGNRAPGEDRITSDMLKADPATSAKCLVGLFNRVWTKEEVPDDWQKGIIIKLPKKGDLSECGNWRGINLLSVPGKVFCRVLLHRMKASIERLLREEQAGFRSGRSCVDQIFVLRTIIEQSLEWNSPLYINFIDFEKAFDSVHHATLWNILRSYGFPSKVINILSSMYANNRCCVRHGGQHSDWFRVKSGVRQGCVISPLLFNIVMDWVMRKATSERPRGISWNAFSHLEDEDFADDVALLSHIQRDMQEKTSCTEIEAGSAGLGVSQLKSKVMRINARSQADIFVNGKPLENVDEFKHLGSYLTADGGIEREVLRRIGLASTAFSKLKPIWSSRVMSTTTKLKLYKSNVRSVLLYAAETWRNNRRIESKLRGFEGRCLRRLLHIRWEHRVTNKEVARRTGISGIVGEVKRRRWRWLGHVLRMNKSRHPHIALTWNPQGQRHRGRPQGTWRRTIDEERKAAGKTWNELRWLAQDRDGWRTFVGALCSQDDVG